jgi:hypothetical protein
LLLGCGGSEPDDRTLSPVCTGDCRVTALTAEFDGTTRVLDRSVFGIADDGTLQIEAYLGGLPGCPTQTSPSVDYAVVLNMVASPTGTESTTAPGNVFDFTGDLLGGDIASEASLVIVSARAASLPEFVALDVYLEFPGGMVSGHVFSTFCETLYGP